MSKEIRCATRRDVAALAGVSVTVVSYVMNGNRYVDEEKRARVLNAARQLNYTPNNVALALRGKNSGQILFIVDNPANERLSCLMSNMDRYCYDRGAVMTQCATRLDPEFVRHVIRRRFDGIIISSISLPDAFIQQFVNSGIPTVLLLTRDYSEITGAARIGTGLYRGEKDAVQFLRARGSQSFLYMDRLSTRNHFSDLSDCRLRGFADSMQEMGHDWHERVITGCQTEEQAQKKVAEYVERFHPDAIIGRNDTLACIAMRQVLQMGLSVPEDIQIIGLDNSSICRFVTPNLTSVQLDDDGISQAAIEMIYRMRDGQMPEETRHFAHRIIERASTRRL